MSLPETRSVPNFLWKFEETPLNNDTLHYLNVRFMGVGFRGYIIKKIVNVHKLSQEQKELASR